MVDLFLVPLHKLFRVWKFRSLFNCPRVLAILCQYAYLLCHVRSDQHTCESGAKLDVKVAFASLWALSFLVMLTCKGIHTTIVWICDSNFFLSCKNTGCFWIRKFSSQAFNSGKTVSVDDNADLIAYLLIPH